MPVLKALLDDIKERWNTHRISVTRRSSCPGGRPDVLFALGKLIRYFVLVTDIQLSFMSFKSDNVLNNVHMFPIGYLIRI